jgi:protein-S-isoprenylcysteine O-methyltransferase Ste14
MGIYRQSSGIVPAVNWRGAGCAPIIFSSETGVRLFRAGDLRSFLMQRRLFFIFGLFCHAMFLAVYAYMCGFVGNILVPKSIDAPAARVATPLAFAIDVALLAAFAVPHSVMARPAFKRWWTTIVSPVVERSVYVFISNMFMIALLAFWQPIGPVVYSLHSPIARGVMWILFACGWLLVPTASLMISHFDLFGTRQVWLNLRQAAYTHLPFHTPMLYKIVRHPLYVGWMIAFWATPTMTVGHLLFAFVLTVYMLIAIPIEERDLVKLFGDKYEHYRKEVPALLPRLRRTNSAVIAPFGLDPRT